MKKDFKTTLNNAVPLGGLGALISNTTPSKTNNLQRVINPPKTGQTKPGEERATFILPETVIQDIKQIAQYEGVQIKEVVTRIFTDYLRNYKPQPKQQPKFTTK